MPNAMPRSARTPRRASWARRRSCCALRHALRAVASRPQQMRRITRTKNQKESRTKKKNIDIIDFYIFFFDMLMIFLLHYADALMLMPHYFPSLLCIISLRWWGIYPPYFHWTRRDIFITQRIISWKLCLFISFSFFRIFISYAAISLLSLLML